jgi:hypothetical protein
MWTEINMRMFWDGFLYIILTGIWLVSQYLWYCIYPITILAVLSLKDFSMKGWVFVISENLIWIVSRYWRMQYAVLRRKVNNIIFTSCVGGWVIGEAFLSELSSVLLWLVMSGCLLSVIGQCEISVMFICCFLRCSLFSFMIYCSWDKP